MRVSSITKNAGKACNNRLYRHIRTFEKIIKNYFVIYYKDINETVAYLENCSEEDIYFISEVFEDVSEQLQSKEYIECLRKLDDKFPNLDMTKDIDLVEEYI